MQIEDKLLSGYWYRNKPVQIDETNERSIIMMSGAGGAKMLIEAYMRLGLPGSVIETLIEVHTDKHGWQPLSAINIQKL